MTKTDAVAIDETERARFEQFYQSHHQMIRNVLFNMVEMSALDDLVQETFLRAWKSLPKFSSRSSLQTWVYRIAVNAAIDFRRRRVLRPDASFDLEHLANSAQTDPSGGQSDNVAGPWIQRGLKELDENHRSVLVLHYFEELSLEKISEILEIPLGTVKSRLHTGRSKLKKYLQEKGVGDGF